MKPAFSPELALNRDKTRVDVGGPYELEGGEKDAYFWFRISQPPAREQEEAEKEGQKVEVVEAIGTHEREDDQMATELTAYRDAVRAAIAEAVTGALPGLAQAPTRQQVSTAAAAARDAAETAIAEQGPTWMKRGVKVRESKKFRTGAATAEGWLLMKSAGDPRGSNLFWTTEVTLVAQDAAASRRR